MENRVFLGEKGFIEVHVVGDQTEESVQEMGDEIISLLDALRAQHKQVLILDDITAMKDVTKEGRQRVVSLAKTLDYDKAAMLGTNNTLLRLGTNLMLRATGRGAKVKYFDKRKDAINWLLQT